MDVKWTNRALRSLTRIAEYIAKDNPSRAASFMQEIVEKTNMLANFPSAGRPGRAIGSRELVVHKNYIVAYWVQNGRVEILQIHHVAQRWPDSFA